MKFRNLVPLLWVIILLSLVSSAQVLRIRAQPSVPFKAARVVWGLDPDSPIRAYPGDTEQSLTAEVQNLSPNETIKGVVAVLMLGDSPFTDLYGNSNVTATGEPEIGGLLEPTDEILPKGFFTLTFSLDIDNDATPGSYQCEMILSYSVNVSGVFLDGEPKTLSLTFVLSKIESTVTCSVAPQSVEKYELIDVSGLIDPNQDNVTIQLVYENPNGSTYYRVSRTYADGSYRDSFQASTQGFWTVNASWAGDIKHEGNWAAAFFEVRLPALIDVHTSGNRLIGGVDNKLNITLINAGEVNISAVDLTLEVPQPLVVYRDDQWTFEFLRSGSSKIIPLEIYAPDSQIGTTYRGSLNLNYRDYYGETHTKSHPISFIVTGKIQLVVYNKAANIQSPRPGTPVSITGTVLNKGNMAARYVNATILPNPILNLTSESTTYIGEIEENAPTPFTLLADLNQNLENGTYPLAVSITYIDDRYEEHVFTILVNLNLNKASESHNGSGDTEGLGGSLQEAGVVILIIAGASTAIVLLFRRHRAQQRKALET